MVEAYIKSFIHSVWGSRDENMFPGPHPISLERSHHDLLSKQPYVVCEKTDGIRYLLVCTTFENRKYCVLVNRAFQVRYTRLAIPRDTIIDGELVDSTFHIYDGVLVSGENIMQLNLIERLKKIEKVTHGPTMGTKLKMKKMWSLKDFASLVDVTEHNNDIDGYIFTPVYEPVRLETHESLVKWKPVERITVDFLCKNGGLYIWDRSHGYMKIQNTHEEYQDKILECKRVNGVWTLVKIREDKTYPNNRRTYMRTLVNIRESISLNELKIFIANITNGNHEVIL